MSGDNVYNHLVPFSFSDIYNVLEEELIKRGYYKST